MASYEYITKNGQTATFEAPDSTSALQLLNSKTDRNPSSGVRLVSAQPIAQPPTTTQPGAPVVPSPVNYGETARTAGAAGLSLNDTAALFGATPEEQKAQKDQLAKQFGFADSDAFYADVFQKPSKTTEQFYREAYSAAGLDGILSKVEEKKAALNKAMGVVNDNPWYDEAFRRGEASRLQQMADADIANFMEMYDLSHAQVKELVARHSDDIGYDEKTKTARFNYLESAAKEAALNLSTSRARETLSSYVEGKQSASKPQTITVGDSVYAWNPNTNTFELSLTKPKTYAPSTAKAKTTSGSSADKTVAAFRTALASRTSLNRAGTREQFIRELQAKFKDIEPADIARAVYETYPDNYDQK